VNRSYESDIFKPSKDSFTNQTEQSTAFQIMKVVYCILF